MNETHPCIQALKCARKKLIGENEEISIKLVDDRSSRDKRYCQETTASEVAVISDLLNKSPCNIILTSRDNDLKIIDELNSAYDALAYPLFGSNTGFQSFLPHEDGMKNITIHEFYAFQLHQ